MFHTIKHYFKYSRLIFVKVESFVNTPGEYLLDLTGFSVIAQACGGFPAQAFHEKTFTAARQNSLDFPQKG
jgi:hypothetical protein